MYASLELKGALTGARYLAGLKGQLAERFAARLDALSALDATRHRHSPLAIAEHWEKPLSGGVRLESGRDFELPVLTQNFIHKSLDDLSALGVL